MDITNIPQQEKEPQATHLNFPLQIVGFFPNKLKTSNIVFKGQD